MRHVLVIAFATMVFWLIADLVLQHVSPYRQDRVQQLGRSVCVLNKHIAGIIPQNSSCGIVTHRRNTSLICSFLREVCGECGEAGKGKVTYRRYAQIPNLIRLSVQYDFVLCTLRFSFVLNPVCAPSIY